MLRRTRSAMALLTLVLFALGGMVHGLSATQMQAAPLVAAASVGDPGHGGCCPVDEAEPMWGTVCHALCASPVSATAAPSGFVKPAAASPLSVLSGLPGGRSAGPDPHPPKPVP